MSRKLIFNIIVVMSILASSACNRHHYYSPNEPILLRIKDEKEIKLSASAPGTFQAGYSPLNHLSIAGSFFRIKKQSDNSSIFTSGPNSPSTGNGHLASGAIGGYWYFDKSTGFETNLNKSNSWGILFDVYAGYGFGKVNNFYEGSGTSTMDLQQYFIQEGLHFNSNYFDLGFVLKQSRLNYYSPYLTGDVPKQEFSKIESLVSENPFNNFEITFYVSGGYDYIKAFTSVNVLQTNNQILQATEPNINIGIILELNKFIETSKKSRSRYNQNKS